MSTGGGNSLYYQLPAVIMSGTVVVISPLISLMQDQAAQLDQLGIPAAILNSWLTVAEQAPVVHRAIWGAYRVPERLARQDTVDWLAKAPVAFFAIDKAHCISE
jgi:ATP-dependent DNA helicase RecQ